MAGKPRSDLLLESRCVDGEWRHAEAVRDRGGSWKLPSEGRSLFSRPSIGVVASFVHSW